MKNLKPSQLPLNTVIEFDNTDYIKVDGYSGVAWEELACPDCRGGLYDIKDREADIRFTKFKILALPPDFRFPVAEPNQGEGWYEFIHPTKATTHIAAVLESGDIYLPEEGTTYEDFILSAARGTAHRLIRADDETTHPLGMDGKSK